MSLKRCLLVALVLTGCSSADEEVPILPPSLVHTFGPFELAVGEEVTDRCVSWTVHNPDTIYVNAVEMTAGVGFHHSNWFYVPEDRFDGPDGVWPCEERGFNEAIAAGSGGVLYAQSTQSTHEVQQFPEGAALAVPPGSRVIASVHLLNATAEPLTTQLDLALRGLPEGTAPSVLLAGMSFEYTALALPPKSRSEFSTTCDLSERHESQLHRPVDFDIYWVLPHYHALGAGFRLEAVGDDGAETIFDTGDTVGHAWGKMLEPRFSMIGYTGVRLTCRYDNPRDETVGWGNGDQEMCVMLAFTSSEHLWGGGVLDGEPGEPTMAGDVAHFEQDCFVISYPASHNRPPE
jgi:hypothetical protein